MNLINAFDPSAASNGTIDVNQAQACSKVILYNHSNIGLQLTFSNGNRQILPAWSVRTYTLPQSGTSRIDWKQAYILQSDGTNISTVYGESYAPNENAPSVNQQLFISNVQAATINAWNSGAGGATISIPVQPTGKLLYITGFTVSAPSCSLTSEIAGTISLLGVATANGSSQLNYTLVQPLSGGMLFDKNFAYPVPQLTGGEYYTGYVELQAINFDPNRVVQLDLYGIFK